MLFGYRKRFGSRRGKKPIKLLARNQQLLLFNVPETKVLYFCEKN